MEPAGSFLPAQRAALVPGCLCLSQTNESFKANREREIADSMEGEAKKGKHCL